MQRRAEFRPFSWLNDLRRRQQLDLSPPYQRRSVWPDRYKSDFVTTALLNYPAPAIFLFEEIRADGSFTYKVIDGKQRLSTLFSFVDDEIAVAEDYPRQNLRGALFSKLADSDKLSIWRYAFAVEFIEQENELLINEIFNRINKNVARLSPQELRHAKFSGKFAQSSEDLAFAIDEALGAKFPYIAPQSRRQMKDVENAASLLLFIETGEKSLSQLDMDNAFQQREEEWENQNEVVNEFRNAMTFLKSVTDLPDGAQIKSSRLRNQADFYSLFAAVIELARTNSLPNHQVAADRLVRWTEVLAAGDEAPATPEIGTYLAAARAASNDPGPRRTRINHMKTVLTGG